MVQQRGWAQCNRRWMQQERIRVSGRQVWHGCSQHRHPSLPHSNPQRYCHHHHVNHHAYTPHNAYTLHPPTLNPPKPAPAFATPKNPTLPTPAPPPQAVPTPVFPTLTPPGLCQCAHTLVAPWTSMSMTEILPTPATYPEPTPPLPCNCAHTLVAPCTSMSMTGHSLPMAQTTSHTLPTHITSIPMTTTVHPHHRFE